MNVSELRIYAEVLEQGLDFRNYLADILPACPMKNVYAKKTRRPISQSDSVIGRIRKVKDVDVFLTAVCGEEEIPILMVEYSTAVPADDHKMQRSDVYFWGAVFKVPALKICPADKGMEQGFGGGDKITDGYEIALGLKVGAVLHIIPWENMAGTGLLDVNPEAPSCIKRSGALGALLRSLITSFCGAGSREGWYQTLYGAHAEQNAIFFRTFEETDPHALFTDSSRFSWEGEKLIVKINRFGHAMDPDRGILYFVNMLAGAQNTVAEFQVNRSEIFDARGGYAALLDEAPHEAELKRYIRELIETQNNAFTAENALYILTRALNLPPHFIRRVRGAEYVIEDNALYAFFLAHPSMAAKSIFFLATKLILTDKNREQICSITWSGRPIAQYFDALRSANCNVTPLKRLSFREAKEDIVTYASALLYQKINCDLLAVSYPGAQGDRCILRKSGRSTLRTYIDIIACQNRGGRLTVFLEECKDDIKDSLGDVAKLHEILDDPQYYGKLQALCMKLADADGIEEVYCSIGAKAAPVQDFFDVDYIFLFDLDGSLPDRTRIRYAIAFLNTRVAEKFRALMDGEGRMTGFLDLVPIYCIP